MKENVFLSKNRRGRKALVLSMKSVSLDAVEQAGRLGFDAVQIDCQHSAVDLGLLDAAVRVAHGYGLTVAARVPKIEYAAIGRFLDTGVQGLTVPNVETAEQVHAIVDAALYPPRGARSFGACRGTAFGDPTEIDAHGGKAGFMAWLNDQLTIVVQIETRRGWENLDAILAVDGLTGVALGPNDLAGSLGHPGETGHPEVAAAVADIQSRARAAGKLARGNLSASFSYDDFLLESLRIFVAEHADDVLG